MCLMTRAGMPATTTLLGTSRLTTAFAATTAFSPIVTPGDVLAEVRVERWEQPERSVHRGARKTLEQRADLARVAVTDVHLGDDALRVGDQRSDLRVTRAVEGDDLEPRSGSQRIKVLRLESHRLAKLMTP